MEYVVTCASVEETADFAAKLANKLRGSEVIQLIGDMGSGKTTFTKGLVEALGSDDYVTSPTFTICNKYKSKFNIYHCDFYRLANDKLIEEELAEMLGEKNVIILEWGENIKSIDSIDHVDIKIETLDEYTRRFKVSSSAKFKYLEIQ